MFATFLEFYVRVFTTMLPALALTTIALSARRAELPWKTTAWVMAGMGLLFGLWHALAARMGELNLLMPPQTVTSTPYILFFLLGGAALLVVLARIPRLGRTITDAADQRVLMLFQVPRVMGAVFLLGWALGEIPWQFALPAGLGDVWAGVAGWQAYRALESGRDDAEATVWRANLIGVADFVVAVLTGIMTSEGFAHIMAQSDPNIINRYPLVLFPALFVPVFLAAHIISVFRLRQAARLQTA
ncbi:hypothetical protein [Roseibium aggregatum]|uniref:Uncharacterized protein n=1 Tax=Roseibium aggregatum TaxID=187304 RepID=A0A939J2P8_9HYPH|nr:hypothetical protein [Roseibium aggregatum]MBN9669330.1 hypothetical protein [Roseibium aggregatum]